MRDSYDYDIAVVGSGFGGSVAALRLSEKGYRVVVLEQGRRIANPDIERAVKSVRHLFWMPGVGLNGFFTQTFFRHLMVVGGAGVGGGSLVYAAVLLRPGRAFFEDPAWSGLGVDWQAELAPHYATAERMLGCQMYPNMHEMDCLFQRTAVAMGAGDTFGPVPLGIYLGEAGVSVPDPYFGGRGPARTGCKRCGECLAGCAYESKNSLDKNYLLLAEQNGAKVLPEHRVTLLRPLPGGGYQVEASNPLHRGRPYPPLRVRKVVLAAGVLGTLQLLFRCRDEFKTLPELSHCLGSRVRTNSEAVVGVLARNPQADLSGGPTISSHFFAGNTHVTQNRFPHSYSFMKLYSGPLVDGDRQLMRALRVLLAYLKHPLRATASLRARSWHRRLSAMTVMQQADNQLAFRYGRSLFSFFRRGLQSAIPSGGRAPAYLPEANRAAEQFARISGGVATNSLIESLLNLSVTAHILGGCPVGATPEQGVIEANQEVFNYPGLYVVDGSAVSANVGVNPSLTITALAERAMSLVPANGAESDTQSIDKSQRVE